MRIITAQYELFAVNKIITTDYIRSFKQLVFVNYFNCKTVRLNG